MKQRRKESMHGRADDDDRDFYANSTHKHTHAHFFCRHDEMLQFSVIEWTFDQIWLNACEWIELTLGLLIGNSHFEIVSTNELNGIFIQWRNKMESKANCVFLNKSLHEIGWSRLFFDQFNFLSKNYIEITYHLCVFCFKLEKNKIIQ